jgi:hypothetical protein
MSETTHVFCVHEDLVSDWEDILATIDPDGGNFETVANKQVDDVFVNKNASLLD